MAERSQIVCCMLYYQIYPSHFPLLNESCEKTIVHKNKSTSIGGWGVMTPHPHVEGACRYYIIHYCLHSYLGCLYCDSSCCCLKHVFKLTSKARHIGWCSWNKEKVQLSWMIRGGKQGDIYLNQIMFFQQERQEIYGNHSDCDATVQWKVSL